MAEAFIMIQTWTLGILESLTKKQALLLAGKWPLLVHLMSFQLLIKTEKSLDIR